MAEIEQFQEDVELSLREVEGLLVRHKRVEDLVHRQEMRKHDLVEGLVHKQHNAELQNKLDALPPAFIAYILESLPDDDRLLIWNMVKDEKAVQILAELSDPVREALIGTQSYPRKKVMLSAFELQEGRLRQVPVDTREDLVKAAPIWVDLVAPSNEERAWVAEIYGLDLPDPEHHTDLEASARFYVEEDGAIYLHSDFLLDKEDESRNVAVTFILHRNILFSVRMVELPVFRLQRLRARTQVGYVTDGKDVLLDLYAADVEYSADALEDVYAALEAVGRQVLSTEMTDSEAAKVLAAIAGEEDLNGRIRRNVLDTRRAVSFLVRGRLLSSNQLEDTQQILRDIESLDGHTSFLFGKINFLMDATVGFININQNKIIKIFSVASVALLPPTLIASIYGMNFKGWFPELSWEYGYPFSLALMVISVAVPFYLFYKRGWLRLG